jgi:hypothetical protein
VVSLYRPTVVLEPRCWKRRWSGEDGGTWDACDVRLGGIVCKRLSVTSYMGGSIRFEMCCCDVLYVDGCDSIS